MNDKDTIKCPNCNGEVGLMWVDGGEYMELGWEDCEQCSGTGIYVEIKNKKG